MLNILLFILEFIERHVIWIYALCILLIIVQIRAYIQARQNRLNTIFPIEREVAIHREGRAMSNIGAILGALIAVLILRYYIVPTVNVAELVEPTPTIEVLLLTATPTQTPTVIPPTPTPRPRPTRPPVVTIALPTPTPVPTHPCQDPNIKIASPLPGAVVAGRVAIQGTANHGRFQFYKVEFGQGEEPTAWHVINDIHRAPVVNGTLETLDTTVLPNGVYWLKLTVVDQTGNFPPPCQIRITVGN